MPTYLFENVKQKSQNEKTYSGVVPIVVDNEANKISVNKATTETEGVVKPDGTTIIVKDGVITSTGGGEPYTLPPATSDTLGGVKVGKGLSATEDGTLSATGIEVEIVDNLTDASTDKALSANMGKTLNESKQAKLIAGDNITITEDNVISSTGSGSYILPPATVSTLGGIKVGKGLSATEDGTLSATGVDVEIIDNLTDTSADKALSANMGKTLNDTKQDQLTAGDGIIIEKNDAGETIIKDKALRFPNQGYTYPGPADRKNTISTFANNGDVKLENINSFKNIFCIRVADTESTTNLNIILPSPDERKGKVIGFADNDGKQLEMKDISSSSYTLPVAATDILGGIKISGDFEITKDGKMTIASIKWTVNNLPSNQNWRSVCYGNGRFVAIANRSNKAMYSDDGNTWKETVLPAAVNWRSVCYGNGRFVAISSVNLGADTLVFAYSDDGIEWKQANVSGLGRDRFYDVTFGNGAFVAITYLDYVAAYSTDGINWQAVKLSSMGGYDGTFTSICYGDGKFVAVTADKSLAIYSIDGLNWQTTSLPIAADYQSVCYGAGKFVAVADYSAIAAYSEDGITWKETTLPFSADWYSVCYGGGKFVAVAENSKTAAYSTDGITWNEFELPISADWRAICYDEKFVAVAYSSNKALCGIPASAKDYTGIAPIVVDNVNNSIAVNVATNDSLGVCRPDGTSIVIQNGVLTVLDGGGYTLPIASERILGGIKIGDDFDITGDGVLMLKKKPIKFRVVNFSRQAPWYAVYGAGKFVAVSGANKANLSYNGIDFEEFNLPEAEFWNTIAYGNGRFVASTSQSNTTAFSTDGMTWTKVDKPSGCYNTSEMCYCDGKFMCCSNSSKVLMISENGEEWTTIFKPDEISRIVNLNGKILGLRSGLKSNLVSWLESDGTWTDVTLPLQQSWCAACQNNETTLVIGNHQGVQSDSENGLSTDKAALLIKGSDWQTITLPIDQSWVDVASVGGKYIAIGNDNLLLPTDHLAISSNASDWTTSQLPLSAAWTGICAGNGKFLLTTFDNSNGVLGEFDE